MEVRGGEGSLEAADARIEHDTERDQERHGCAARTTGSVLL